MNFEESGAGIRFPGIKIPQANSTVRRPNTMPMELVDISAIRVVPISDGEMPEGFYMGRKHRWQLDASFVTVMLLLSQGEPRILEVHEPGSARISRPREWLFIGRVIGLREVSASYRRAAEAWERGEFSGGA